MRRDVQLVSIIAALTLFACSRTSEPVAEAPRAAEPVISEQEEMIGRGEAIAEAACANCHAIGAETDSPHPEAPAFRILEQRHPLNTLAEDFEDGVVTTHPDMPNWQFEQIDIDALVAYLKSVQAGGAE